MALATSNAGTTPQETSASWIGSLVFSASTADEFGAPVASPSLLSHDDEDV